MTTYSTPPSEISAGGMSLVDAHTHFDGVFRTTQDLRVDGRCEGQIHCDGTLFVSESAVVSARVQAGRVSVAGSLQGEIRCRSRFEIIATGRVNGRVLAGTVVVHDGAFFDGELRMRREGEPEEPEPAAERTVGLPPRRRTPSLDLGSSNEDQTTPSPRFNGRPTSREGADPRRT